MPDSLGRYYLGPNSTAGDSLIDRVRRLLSANAVTVDASTGAELTTTIQNRIFSNVDIVNQINTSLMALYSEVVLAREDQFSQTFYVSTEASNPGPYAFPPGMLQLRYMDWKPPSILFANVRPSQWIEMLPLGDPMDRGLARDFGAPTWEYDNSGSGFVLNELPALANANGIRIRAVVLPPALVATTDVIQARFARVMQEAVIYDTAYALAWSKLKQVTDEMTEGRKDWHQRLISTAENAFHPPSTQMLSNRLIANTYSGRRGRGRW